MAGIVGQPFLTDYCASKFGAIGLMESLRLEMKRANKNIVCTTVCPFFINTGMFDGAAASTLFPFLEQQAVIDRIMSAILQNEGEVHISWLMGHVSYSMKALFPSGVCDWWCWALVGWDSMANFRGRQKDNAIHKAGKE